MQLNTASIAVSFARQLETDSSAAYEELAKNNPGNQELFLSFVKENKRFITDVERAYYGVITDALEGCFSFNLESDKYAFPPTGNDPLRQALGMEETITRYYTEAAESSRGLMADVPRMFDLIVKKRSGRIARLKQLSG
jgi:hypothetical protein